MCVAGFIAKVRSVDDRTNTQAWPYRVEDLAMSMDDDIAEIRSCVRRLEPSLEGSAVVFGGMFVCNLALLALILWRVW